MGTATTLDVVSRSGDLLGVVIATGLGLSADTLARTGGAAEPRGAGGAAGGHRAQHDSGVQSGLVYGYAGLVEGLVRGCGKSCGEPDTQVIGTGGLIGLHYAAHEVIDFIDPALTLNGLRLLAEMNGGWERWRADSRTLDGTQYRPFWLRCIVLLPCAAACRRGRRRGK